MRFFRRRILDAPARSTDMVPFYLVPEISSAIRTRPDKPACSPAVASYVCGHSTDRAFLFV